MDDHTCNRARMRACVQVALEPSIIVVDFASAVIFLACTCIRRHEIAMRITTTTKKGGGEKK